MVFINGVVYIAPVAVVFAMLCIQCMGIGLDIQGTCRCPPCNYKSNATSYGTLSLENNKSKTLTILALLPSAGQWRGGRSSYISAQLAVEHINERKDLLPGYKIQLIYTETKCDPGLGIHAMYNELYKSPAKIMILGAGCSPVSEATSRASHYWNVVQLSPVSVSPALSNKNVFPRFFRYGASDTIVNPAKIALFKYYGWRKVAVMHQSLQLFSLTIEELTKQMRQENISVTSSEVFNDDPIQQVKYLKEVGARIIVLSSYAVLGFKVFCQAYRSGLYGPKIVWMTIGWWEWDWWRMENNPTDCTKEELAIAVEGSFRIGVFYKNPNEGQVGIAGINASRWQELYDIRASTQNNSLFDEMMSPQAYDGIWAMALAMNQTLTQLVEKGSPRRLEDFSYDTEIGDMNLQNMFNVSFIGIRGRTAFDENGDLVGMVKICRVENGKEKTIGSYDPLKQSLQWFGGGPSWETGTHPLDSVKVNIMYERVNPAAYAICCSLASAGIVIAISFLVYNVVHRKDRVIKMSSPRINNIILIGCIIAYVTVFMVDLDGSSILELCRIRGVILLVGFSLAYGGLFSKTWRVYLIFTNPKLKRVVIKDWHLLSMVVLILCINLIIYTIKQCIDDYFILVLNLREEINTDGDYMMKWQVQECASRYQNQFMITFYVAQGIMLLFGMFLAWETRNVKIPVLNDSQYIGVCVYNVVILSVLGVIIAMTLDHSVTIQYSVLSAFLIFCTTLTQCLLFVPKIYQRKEGLVSASMCGRTRSSDGTGLPQQPEVRADSNVENVQLMQIIEQKTKVITQLQEHIETLIKPEVELQN